MLQRLFKQSDFLKNIMIMMMGTGLAAAIPVLISPLITRLYSAEEIGTLAVFAALTYIIGGVAGLRYDLAIVLPKYAYQARIFLALSLISIAAVTGIVTAAILALSAFNIYDDFFLFLLPVSVAGFALFQSFGFIVNRSKKYGSLASGRVMNQGISAAAKIGLGSGILPGGLLIGHAAGLLFAAAFLLHKTRYFVSQALGLCRTPALLLGYAGKHSDYPVFNMPAALLGGLMLHLHLLLFAVFYDEHDVGFIALASQIVMAPLWVIGSSYSQVYYEKIARMTEADILKDYPKTAGILIGISAAFSIPITLLPQQFYEFIFGTEWGALQTYVRILACLHALRFVTSATSTIYIRLNALRINFIYNVMNCCLIVIAICLPHAMGYDLFQTLIIFSGVQSVVLGMTLFLPVILLKRRLQPRAQP